MKIWEVTLVIALVCACAFLAGFIFGHDWVQSKLQSNTVAAGHAEYYLNADHDREWRWLPVTCESE